MLVPVGHLIHLVTLAVQLTFLVLGPLFYKMKSSTDILCPLGLKLAFLWPHVTWIQLSNRDSGMGAGFDEPVNPWGWKSLTKEDRIIF